MWRVIFGLRGTCYMYKPKCEQIYACNHTWRTRVEVKIPVHYLLTLSCPHLHFFFTISHKKQQNQFDCQPLNTTTKHSSKIEIYTTIKSHTPELVVQTRGL